MAVMVKAARAKSLTRPRPNRRSSRAGVARAREIDRGRGFGWAVPRSDELIQAKMGELMGENWALLLGRRSYEGMLSAWNARGGRFKDALNAATKYVASSSSTSDASAGSGK